MTRLGLRKHFQNVRSNLVRLLGGSQTSEENSLSDRSSSSHGHCENRSLAVSYTHSVESRLRALEWWEAGDVLLLEQDHAVLASSQQKTLTFEPGHQVVSHVAKRSIIHHRDAGGNAAFTCIGLDHRYSDVV